MNGPREAIEQAILASLGAAALTRERAEAVVAGLVTRGHMEASDGRAMVNRLMTRVRGEGPPSRGGLLGRVEDGAQAAFRELGLATLGELDDLRLRVAELERRLELVEALGTGGGGADRVD